MRAVATAIVNLAVSIILVNILGINGVFIGTIVAYITTIYVVDPRVVYNKVFDVNVIHYYVELIKRTVLFFVVFMVCIFITTTIEIENWFVLILTFLVLTIAVNLLLFFIYRKSDEYQYIKGIVLDLLSKIKHLIIHK